MRRKILLTLAMVAASGATVRGADFPAVGSEVRVDVAPASERITGTVTEVDGTSIVLQVRGTSTRIPFTRISALEVHQVRRSRGQGAWRGALVGAMVGGLVAADSDGWVPPEHVMIFFGGTFGLIGTAIGVKTTDEWRAVDEKRWRVSLAPVDRGAGARVSLSF